MGQIIEKYFLGDNEESKAIIEEAIAERTKHFEKVKALVSKYEADEAWGRRETISALGFKIEEGAKPALKENFLKPEIKWSEKQRYAVYQPDKRYKAGKAIAEEMKNIGPFNFSDFITKKLGVFLRVTGTFRDQMTMMTPRAGHYGDRLIVVIPWVEEEDGRELGVPSFLKAIKKSEFIAITEEDHGRA